MIFYIIILILVIAFAIYAYLTNRAMKMIVDVNEALQLSGRQLVADISSLTDKYRQLVKINQALREITEVKNLKKK